MSAGYSWLCGCGLAGTGEAAAMRHARTCPLMGRPWSNPDYPKPEAAA